MITGIPGATSLSGTTGYSYDTKDQITQETSTRNGGFTDNFGYDSAGNPTTFKGVTKTYNSNNQQTGTGFSHDANGNPTNYAGITLTFDPENRLTGFGSVLTAGYRGDGLRAWKQSSGNTTYFLYDGILPVVELNASGSVSATNTFGAAGLVSRRASSTSVFYTFDSEGNVSQRTDASGSVLSNQLFAAHGVTLSGTLSGPFGYKAQFSYYTDNETGLQLLTHRYYDPNSGRLLTRDPISYNGGINLYSYVGNNPANVMDPLGLDGWGNDAADWLDRKIDALRRYLEPNPDAVNWNTLVNYATNVYHGQADLLRVGSGVGRAIFEPCGSAEDAISDVGRASVIALILAGPAAEIAGSVRAAGGTPVVPDFLGQESDPAIPVPESASGPIPTRGPGVQYTGGSGGNGLDPSVSNMRIMDPTARYPNGYVNYSNGAVPKPQSVNPYTGQTVGKASPWWHIPLGR